VGPGLVILKNSLRKRGGLRALMALACLTSLAAPSAQARTHHNDAWAREHFATAERMREALNGRPPADRTRRDYQKVLNAYRSVYMAAPSSAKADPSVVAVAETLVEMGRRFNDDQILTKAIDQYKFLRREYPGSKYRFDGLFTIGEIYKDDLNNSAAARATFQDFLRRYPNNRLADGARLAIEELNQVAKSQSNAPAATGLLTGDPSPKRSASKQPEKNGKKVAAKDDTAKSDAAKADDSDHAAPASSAQDDMVTPSRLPRLTGIRHWSTPDYTRVAIDLEGDVIFSSKRIADPSRIFFDLRGTKLASTLVGKSFDVDDGFLKKVRVAQFAPGRTRVVLDVDSLSEYDAFLLPDPYRLIIDIHGKNGRASKAAKNMNSAADNVEAGSEDAGAALVADAADSGDSSAAGISDSPSVTKITADPGKKPQTAIVKRIVEADDNEPSAMSPKSTKRTLREKKTAAPVRTAAAGNTLDGAADTTDASDLMAANDARSNVPEPHRKSSSRSASNKGVHDPGSREARPTASGDRSLIRALGLKIGKIVIDPGHGGHDTGTIGPNGLEEKDLVLEVGRRLGKLLETRLGAEVVYTRKVDTFIPLETRTAIANQARADLFVSIHANSSHDPDARGVETYYLNFTSSPEALEVAARENAVSEKSIFELQDLVKKIALKEKIEESREFASDVQTSLHTGLAVKSPAIRDRGVKKAPFIVLIGANMPSILAEISFVSNPTDERRLSTSEYRERIAESLYRGIAKYVNGLSGVKVASKMDKGAGQ
jgi:N-acetylmuramoyl-L-alanine amidase